jgi:hypothetical protein
MLTSKSWYAMTTLIRKQARIGSAALCLIIIRSPDVVFERLHAKAESESQGRWLYRREKFACIKILLSFRKDPAVMLIKISRVDVAFALYRQVVSSGKPTI